jgi:hypothetical protein
MARRAPTKVGGVAYGDPGQEFVPGRYIRHGYGFTSRGCPRRCWFCSVWKRDPTPRLLPITDCWNVLDDNLLACPPETPSQEKYAPDDCWRAFQRRRARPAIIHARQLPRTPKAIMLIRKGLDADQQNRRPRGRPKNVYNGSDDVHIFQRPSGNSSAAALRRSNR